MIQASSKMRRSNYLWTDVFISCHLNMNLVIVVVAAERENINRTFLRKYQLNNYQWCFFHQEAMFYPTTKFTFSHCKKKWQLHLGTNNLRTIG